MAYPASLTFKHQATSSRWWALGTMFGIKSISLIPHFFLLFFLQLAAMVVMMIGIFAVLFTGRYPQGMENFVIGVAKWGWRVCSFYMCLSDKYPPFTMKDVDNPAVLNFQHQEKSSRLMAVLTLIPVKYFMLIPHIFVMIILEIAAAFSIFIGIFAVLFIGRYPQCFENAVVRFFNYGFRVQAYFMCLTDQYPPISWKA